MTANEAIEILENTSFFGRSMDDIDTALEMAIKALSETKRDLSDIISRTDAIEELEHMLSEPQYQHTGEDWYVGVSCAQSKIYDLPSAQPDKDMIHLQKEQAYMQGWADRERTAQPESVIHITGTRKHVPDFSELDARTELSEESYGWCTGCKEYDTDAHCCHRWSKQIRKTVAELEAGYPQAVKDELEYWRERAGQTERKKGEWVYGEYDGQDGWFCSECRFFIPWYYDFYGLDNIDFIRDYHTCPCCDAKMIKYTGMRGEEEEDEV